jgi:hypothetical protein
MKKIFKLACVCVLTSCGPIEDFAMTREAKDALAFVLKDTVTAEFRDLTRSGGGLCGWVNAKNSMAGYTGYTQFVTEVGEVYIFSDLKGDDAARAFELAGRCKFRDHNVAERWSSGQHEIRLKAVDDYVKAAKEVARLRALEQ